MTCELTCPPPKPEDARLKTCKCGKYGMGSKNYSLYAFVSSWQSWVIISRCLDRLGSLHKLGGIVWAFLKTAFWDIVTYHTNHSFKVYTPMIFCIFTVMQPSSQSILVHCITPKRSPYLFAITPHFLLTSSAYAITNLISVPRAVFF